MKKQVTFACIPNQTQHALELITQLAAKSNDPQHPNLEHGLR